jgi:hypothetical protein
MWGEYDLSDAQGWRGSYDTRMIRIERLWEFTRLYEQVAGDSAWTGIDYLGEVPRTRFVKSSFGQ